MLILFIKIRIITHHKLPEHKGTNLTLLIFFVINSQTVTSATDIQITIIKIAIDDFSVNHQIALALASVLYTVSVTVGQL